MENSLIVREKGLVEFMKFQKDKYTCSMCGGIISVHDVNVVNAKKILK